MKTCMKCGKSKALTEFNRKNSSRDGFQGKCRECEKEYKRTRVLIPAPPEGMTEKRCCACKETKSLEEFGKNRTKMYGLADECRPCVRAAKRDWHNKNKEEVNRGRRERNRERKVGRVCKECHTALALNKKLGAEFCGERCYKRWRYVNDPEFRQSIDVQTRRYRESEKGRVIRRTSESNRRAAKSSSNGKAETSEWLTILRMYGGKCLRCSSTDRITMDHIRPLASLGSNWPHNLQPLCLSCNASKGARHETDYRPQYPRAIEFPMFAILDMPKHVEVEELLEGCWSAS
jgi:hypothetical protein